MSSQAAEDIWIDPVTHCQFAGPYESGYEQSPGGQTPRFRTDSVR
jgi:hypothetical protein